MTRVPVPADNDTGDTPKDKWEWQDMILNSDLAPRHRLVLLALAARMKADGGGCFPSIQRIQQDTGLGRSAVYDILADLKRRGWVTVDSGGGRRRTNGYRPRLPQKPSAQPDNNGPGSEQKPSAQPDENRPASRTQNRPENRPRRNPPTPPPGLAARRSAAGRALGGPRARRVHRPGAAAARPWLGVARGGLADDEQPP